MSIRAEHLNHIYGEGTAFEQYALKDVSFEIEDGQFIGLIGHTGSGKSTLIRLVNGLETADSGKVTVCGKELSTLKKPELRALRRKIGMVFQQFNLLESKTVYHNIALPLILAKTPKVEIDKKVKEVLKIVELEDKKDTYISQLSGGQKQRIAIARAILKNAPVLLLDEPTSALDVETESEIQEAIRTVMAGRTCITIAHRLSTIQNADRIYVLKQGQIAECGTHEELLATGGAYAAMYGEEADHAEL